MTVLATRNAGVIAYPLNPNDHGPAHVHVLGPGWVVVANLIGMERELAQHLIGNLFVDADDFADTHEVDACGLGIHVPALDADLYVPALLEGVLGSERWMAARMGAKGGRARGAAKAAAVRENGRKGGRPRKAGAG